MFINPNVELYEDGTELCEHGLAHKHTVADVTLSNDNIDEHHFELAKRQADAINSTLTPVYDELAGMTSTEARIYIERKYKPLLVTAVHQHKEACDNVTHFEDYSDSFKTQERTRYAYALKHPEIIKVQCAGAEHLSHLMRDGTLNKEGYKLAENRPVSLSIGNVQNTRSTIVLIPVERQSLMDYSATPEAREYAENNYQRELKKLISKRNAAAVALTELRDETSAKWASIPDFEDMLKSGVRKGRK